MLDRELPCRRTQLAATPDGSRTVVVGASSANPGQLVVHDLFFAPDEPVESTSTFIQPPGVNEGETTDVDAGVAVSDSGHTWLVAWHSDGHLYWKFQDAPISEGLPFPSPLSQAPEVVYLGDADPERVWAIVHAPMFDNPEARALAYIVLDAEGHVTIDREVERTQRESGYSHRSVQVTHTPEGLVLAAMRDRRDFVPMSIRAYMPPPWTVLGLSTSRLSRPHPMGSSEESVREFFPFAGWRLLDIHWFKPTTDAEPGLYMVWTYARTRTESMQRFGPRRWHLMWSHMAIPRLVAFDNQDPGSNPLGTLCTHP